MSTLRELIESNVRLADSVLEKAQADNRIASAFDKLSPHFEQLRIDQQAINEKLAVLLDNVKDVKKEVTGTQLLQRDDRTSLERGIDRFEKLSVTSKILIAVLLVIAAASGWLTHLL